jgi:outer membrane scaffolding protein for murein synthesis (MipA/OmpV family)
MKACLRLSVFFDLAYRVTDALPSGALSCDGCGLSVCYPIERRIMRFCILALLCIPSLAAAQDAGAEDANGISFTLGLGGQVKPEYFGAEDTKFGPTGSFDFGRLQFDGLSMGGPKAYGLGFGPSFRIIGARDADDYEELAGLEDVDFAVELGGGLEFTAPDYEVFAKLRYGVIGHESLVAEMGGDVFYRPTDQITLSAGPRVLWGSDDYSQTYFGVTDAEELASSFDAFDAGAGIMSAGIAAEANYQFNDTWGVTGKIRYEQLRDDAADSPITQSDDQISASVVVTRRITLGF